MKFTRALCFVSLFAVAGVGFGQIAQPPAELKELEWMIGEWTGKAHWEFPGTPPMDAEMTFKTAWEGPFMRSTSVMEMMGMKVTEDQYLAYDAAKKRFTGWTFTNLSPMPRIEHGTVEAGKFIMISEPWDAGMGEPMVSRGTTIKKSDNEFEFTLELKTGETWAKAGWGTFKKKVAGAG